MDLKSNTPVTTNDGDKVGELDRVVVSPVTDRLTHIVVKKGWLFTKEKVIPASDLETVSDEVIVLKKGADKLSDYMDFNENTVVAQGSHEAVKKEKSLHARKVLWYYRNVALPGPASFSEPYPTRDAPLFAKKKEQAAQETGAVLEKGSKGLGH